MPGSPLGPMKRTTTTSPGWMDPAARASQAASSVGKIRAGPVWRREKPGPGRFREFYQCDFDTVGTSAPAADAEVCAVVCDGLEALEREAGVEGVLVAEDEQIKRLNAARFQLDVMGVSGILVARTDAEAATLLDGRSIEAAPLDSGSVVRVGGSVLLYERLDLPQGVELLPPRRILDWETRYSDLDVLNRDDAQFEVRIGVRREFGDAVDRLVFSVRRNRNRDAPLDLRKLFPGIDLRCVDDNRARVTRQRTGIIDRIRLRCLLVHSLLLPESSRPEHEKGYGRQDGE